MVTFIGIELPVDEFVIILFDISYLCCFQQVVPIIHFGTETV